MFTPGRYIVVDDNEAELRALIHALHQIGAPGIGVHYDAAQGVRPELLRGVRVLFLDLHLIGGVQVGGQKKTYDVIVQLLEDGINASSGPYVIILWTAHASQRAEFEAYLIDRLSIQKRPLAILALDKSAYLVNPSAEGAERLRKDVTDAIAADSRIHALLLWERDVLAAAGSTLSALGELVDPKDRTPANYGAKLDVLLSVLAAAAVGRDHAERNVRSAINAALAPILSDRIYNQEPDEAAEIVWKAAVTNLRPLPELDAREAAGINTMLHVARPPGENVTSTDWGAVVRLPQAEITDGATMNRFACRRGDLLFKVSPARDSAGRAASIPVLVRIGAGCDYAQSRPGPIPYVFGVILPFDVRERDKHPKAQFDTPVLMLPGFLGPVRIVVNATFQVSLVADQVSEWPALCRLREGLLMQLTSHCAEYATRPGIVSIPHAVNLASADESVPAAPAGETEGAARQA